MASTSAPRVSSFLAAVALAASCATPPPRAPLAGGSGPPPVHGAAVVLPERRPTLGVTTPMAGEPSGSALAEARLVASSCHEASTDDVEASLKEMREAIDRNLKAWLDAQPGCQAALREEERWRKELSTRHKGGPWPMPSVAPRPAMIRSDAAASRSTPAPTATAQAATAPRGAAPADAPADKKKAEKASGTNNQVAGVDEADIVKADGRWMYFAANGALRIADALTPRVVSVTKLPGTVRELFVEGDRAVVYTSSGGAGRRCTYGYDCQFAGDGTSTTVSVLDVSNCAEPKVTRSFELSGSLLAARRIGATVHTVVSDNDARGPAYAAWPPGVAWCGADAATVRQKMTDLEADNERRIRARATAFPTIKEGGKETTMCGGLLRTAIRDGQAFTSVVSFDMKSDAAPPTSATIQSRPGAVFASADALYLSVVHQKAGAGGRWYASRAGADEVSEIHKFRIGASPKDTRYAGSGTVPGHVLNQFAMDEWYGYLRVATTRGRVPDPKTSSVVSVLSEADGGNLVRVGAVEDIAPGEDIRSVRFEDDRGYVVTFKKTDPLFVLDLFQPQRPAILGELKIPGFSTYMHRVDPDHLLSIGFDANDHGSFAYFDGVILQLFDVKNPTEPKLLFKEKIGTRGSSSEAATDHLAFNYFEGRLAIPMTVCEGGGDGRNGDKLAFSGLLVYDVDVEKGFTRLGGIDHGTKGAGCGTWWSNASSAVKRSVFQGDLVWSIASDRAKVQRLGHFGVDVADLSLL